MSEFSQLYLIFRCLNYYSKDSDLVNILRFCSQIFDVNLIQVDTLKMKKITKRMANSYPSPSQILHMHFVVHLYQKLILINISEL